MKSIIDWAGQRARMVLFFVILSLIAGFYSYINLPKEGEPDIEIPVVFISVPFQGISAGGTAHIISVDYNSAWEPCRF